LIQQVFGTYLVLFVLPCIDLISLHLVIDHVHLLR